MARTAVLLALLATLGLASAHMPMMGGPPDACSTCLLSVRILEDLLCDPAATDFLVDFVETKICPAVGDSAKCHNLAEGLLPTIVQWFRATATPASLCSSAGVCGSALMSVKELTQPALRVRDTAECAMCKYVVSEVKVALNDSAAVERIKEAALKACSELPAELAAGCADFVNEYEPMIADLIENMDGDTVCGLMGVCMAQSLAAVPPPLSPALVAAAARLLARPPPPPHALLMMRAMDAMRAAHNAKPQHSMLMGGPEHGHGHEHMPGPGHMGPMRGLMGLLAGVMGPPPMGGPLGDTCDYCKMAVLEAHALVANPTVQAEMLNYTKAVCEQFSTLSDTCKSYVDLYAPLVFSLLEQYLVPETLCSQTGMCPPPPVPPGSGAGGGAIEPAKGPGGDLVRRVTCAVRALVRGVEGMLGMESPAEDQDVPCY